MPLPILPILMAIPAAASIIHDLWANRPVEERPPRDMAQVQKLLELADTQLAGAKAQVAATEERLTRIQEQAATAEARVTTAEAQLAKAQGQVATAEARATEMQARATTAEARARHRAGLALIGWMVAIPATVAALVLFLG